MFHLCFNRKFGNFNSVYEVSLRTGVDAYSLVATVKFMLDFLTNYFYDQLAYINESMRNPFSAGYLYLYILILFKIWREINARE